VHYVRVCVCVCVYTLLYRPTILRCMWSVTRVHYAHNTLHNNIVCMTCIACSVYAVCRWFSFRFGRESSIGCGYHLTIIVCTLKKCNIIIRVKQSHTISIDRVIFYFQTKPCSIKSNILNLYV
jgi:hypothetical protein